MKLDELEKVIGPGRALVLVLESADDPRLIRAFVRYSAGGPWTKVLESELQGGGNAQLALTLFFALAARTDGVGHNRKLEHLGGASYLEIDNGLWVPLLNNVRWPRQLGWRDRLMAKPGDLDLGPKEEGERGRDRARRLIWVSERKRSKGHPTSGGRARALLNVDLFKPSEIHFFLERGLIRCLTGTAGLSSAERLERKKCLGQIVDLLRGGLEENVSATSKKGRGISRKPVGDHETASRSSNGQTAVPAERQSGSERPTEELPPAGGASVLREGSQVTFEDVSDQRSELDFHPVVLGREWLWRAVQEPLSRSTEHQGLYLLLVAGPLFGKSAFAAEMIRRLPKVAYRFVRQGHGDWDKGDVILNSLSEQVRRHYGLQKADIQRGQTPEGMFYDALSRAAGGVGDGGDVLVLVAGLDEAFGPTGRPSNPPLRTLLPARLPAHCKMILTSTEGKHLEYLRASQHCITLNLETLQAEDNLHDIELWLAKENAARDLKLDEKTLQHLRNACEGFLGVGVRLLQERPSLSEDLALWRIRPEEIPRGVEKVLQWEWDRLVGSAGQHGVSAEDCRRLLGLLAMAKDRLKWEELRALLLSVIESNPAGSFAVPGIVDAVRVFQPESLLRNAERVLAFSGHLFAHPTFVRPNVPLRFFHGSFGALVRNQLNAVSEAEFASRLLAQACANWRDPSLASYALRYRFHHLLDLQVWWGPVGRAFADLDFIEALGTEGGVKALQGVAAQAVRISSASGSPSLAQWRRDFEEWERFLRMGIHRLQLGRAVYAQEVINEFIPSSTSQPPGPLRTALRAVESDLMATPAFWFKKVHGPPTFCGQGHSMPVTALALSEKRARLVSGSSDGTIKIWDVRTSQLMADCVGHSGPVNTLSFAEDGDRLASGSEDGSVRMWDANTGALLAISEREQERRFVDKMTGYPVVIREPRGPVVYRVAFSPDGELLASGGDDGGVTVWDAQNLSRIVVAWGHSPPVWHIAFAHDSQRIATVDRDGVLRLWDARSGASLAVGERASESITGVAFAPDDSRIWTKGISQSATSWENASGKLMAKPLERGAACKDSNDSDDLMGSIQKGEDGTVRVRNLEIARVPQDATKQSRAVISPDGRFLARARADGRVEVIDLRTRSLAGATEPCACGLNSISMSPDGTHLVTNGCDSYWRVWDWRKGALVASRWGSEAVLAFSPDGTSIAVGRGDGIEVWKFSVDELKSGGRDKEVGTIRSLAFSPNGKLVASGHSHGAIVWGAERGIVVGRSYRNKTAVTSVVFSSCGNYLAQGDEEGTVSVWACYATGPEPVRMAPKEANTMWLTQAAELPGPPEDRHREEVWESPVWTMTIGSVNRSGYCVRSLAFSPKSEMLLIGGPRDRVTAWDWRTGAKGVWFVGSPVAAVAFTDAELGEVVVAGDCGEWWAYKMLKPR